MAGIDKTYIDFKDYRHYRRWWIENYSKMVKEMGGPIYLYPFMVFDVDEITPEFLLENKRDLEEYKNINDFPVWNTSERWDRWLVKNCPIKSYRERMLDVYDPKWNGFKGLSWVPKKNKKQRYCR